MYLKSLTLKGFKSFASPTTLNFEPGITCVVGPNGSGKSNVVDALAWVMGEQGAKSLRGGKMEDVIFAGTVDRAPLGRAEVILTIDNTDGALPIDYTEVTISRIMFRNGGSEYAINGEPCRLLDIQELLSDSGIGREMHVIVGQGQLDAILHASPEDRRGFIEEAAGVLKHRKRKEKALRKLEAMQGNLVRLTDLTTELRRQLTPLGKQAEVARRAQVIQIDVRDARSRLFADDLLHMRTALAAEVADETALREMRTQFETEMSALQSRELILDSEIRSDAPRIAKAQENWFKLSSQRERFLGTASLASERVRMLSPVEEEVLGRDPEELDREAIEARLENEKLAAEVESGRARLLSATQHRAEAEGHLTEENRRITDAARAAADRRDGLTRLAGQVDAMRQRIETRTAEIARLEGQIEQARARAEQAQQEFRALESQIAGLDAGERNLDEEHENAAEKLASAERALNELQLAEAAAERDRLSLTSRVEALEMALSRQGGGAALLAANERISGVLGSVAALIHVKSGYEEAVAVALGDAANAIAVRDVDAAIAAMDMLKADNLGRAGLVIAEENDPGEDPVSRRLPDGAVMAADVVEAPAELRSAIRTLLRGIVIVDNLKVAREIVLERSQAIAVTRQGDSVGRVSASGGSASGPSLLQVQAALDEARSKRDAAAHETERLKFEQVSATAKVEAAQKEADATLSGLYESDAQMAAVAEQLGQLSNATRAASSEADRLEAGVIAARAAREADEVSLQELTDRLQAAENAPVESDPDTSYRDVLAADVEAKRHEEMEIRLAVRTSEERQRSAASHVENLERAARDERESRRRFAERKERRAREAAVAVAVLRGAEIAISWIDASLIQASNERTEAEQTRDSRDVEISQVRARSREVASELEKLVDSVHRDEVARAEQRLRIEALENKIMEDLGLDADTLIRDFGPDQLVPPTPPAPGDEVDPNAPEPQPYPYVREEQEKRLKVAERGLALLGKVNPLALEEFSALEERHKFLNEQLDDLRKSRNDLMSIVKDVDERVQQVFAEAFTDTAREFEGIFARLFPGGEGRLVLTDPNDLLNTGIEVEARPPGKKLKRLSLLSGGERSLTAVAFLVALFKSRPSPFYVMDEVEAALDDVNLGRLIEVMKELQDNSQLIVITHQKRTMEIADALYGVTMRGDGISAVISQKLSEARDSVD
ncbi:MAG: chromosome segregation protein [Actinomycetota bacterium]